MAPFPISPPHLAPLLDVPHCGISVSMYKQMSCDGIYVHHTNHLLEELSMSRYHIDCRDYPSKDVHCSVALAADTREELLEAVVQHGAKVHGYEDTPEFRKNIMKEFKEGPAPA
jgi:predicted small metal-binding protein